MAAPRDFSVGTALLYLLVFLVIAALALRAYEDPAPAGPPPPAPSQRLG